MAAQDSDETHRAGLQAGPDEMLVKPLALQDLADVLARTRQRSGDFNIAVCNELCELFDAAGVARLAGALLDDLPAFGRASWWERIGQSGTVCVCAVPFKKNTKSGLH